MATRSGLDTLVRGYHDDLHRVQERTLAALDEGPDNAVPMLHKLVLESVRHDVYEQATLLPAVRDFLPDGDERVRAADEAAGRRAQALDVLTQTRLGGQEFRAALTDVLSLGSEHAEEQEALLDDLRAAMPQEHLEAAGALLTPTQQAGATHSMPDGLTMPPAGGEWPAPGWVQECRRAFEAEVAARRASSA